MTGPGSLRSVDSLRAASHTSITILKPGGQIRPKRFRYLLRNELVDFADGHLGTRHFKAIFAEENVAIFMWGTREMCD